MLISLTSSKVLLHAFAAVKIAAKCCASGNSFMEHGLVIADLLTHIA